jgi:serine/threonine-protein kinase
VFLDDYWIYRTEVTNGMYQKCVDDKACPRPDNLRSNTRDEYYGNPTYANYPVVYVSWRSAAAYCIWANVRLPTEAEWEKAGRGTDGRLFPWGNQTPTKDMACYDTTDTTAVGSYPNGASPYGVLDMAGNVIEWIFDYFSPGYTSQYVNNPKGPASGQNHVYRGGAYHNPLDAIRVVMRGSRATDFSSEDIGFRCAMDQP